MKKITIIILLITIILCFPQININNINALILNDAVWEIVDKLDFPNVEKSEESDHDSISFWTPKPFVGRGELITKWKKEIEYIDESHFNIQSTKNGWIYISPDFEIAEDSYGYLGGENYTNILIDPETGESKTLTPKFLMDSGFRTDKLICSSPYTPKASSEPIDIRCYDLDKDKVIWSINDGRVGRIWASPSVPLFHSNGRYFYIHSGITEFDIDSGEILWSTNLIDIKSNRNSDGYIFPGIERVYVLDDFIIITIDNYSYYKYYKVDLKNKTIDEINGTIDHEQRYIDDDTELWMTSSDNKYFLKYSTDTMNPEKKYGIKLMLKNRIDESYKDTETYYSIDKPVGRFTPIRVFIATEKQILKCYICPGEYFVSDTFSCGYQSILPCYKYKTYDFLFDRDNPYELTEVLPEKASNKKTFIQYFDNQIILHTREFITSYDFETNEELWWIDKSDFYSPEKAKVITSNSHGVLIQDYSNNKKALFYCYDEISESPEPEPQPIPEPIPEQKTILKFQINEKFYSLDGNKRSIDAAPVIKNGRTLLPARYVTEPLGGDVGWDGSEKKVICNLGDVTVELWINSPNARINGKVVQIDLNNPDVVPTIINDRTMVPMRFLAETFGCEVEWVAETKEIILTYTP